jgi:hypothetical protein
VRRDRVQALPGARRRRLPDRQRAQERQGRLRERLWHAVRIAANGFISLSHPRASRPSEAVFPLIARDAATPTVTVALDAVSAKLTTDNLKQLVKLVEVDKDAPRRSWSTS